MLLHGGLNPCFNGCSTPTIKILYLVFHHGNVSILVLMDVVRRREQINYRATAAQVSILVLMDVVRRQRRREFLKKQKDEVSILVLMDVVRRQLSSNS